MSKISSRRLGLATCLALLLLSFSTQLSAQDLSPAGYPSLSLTSLQQGRIEPDDYDEDSGNYIDWYALKVKKGQRIFVGLASDEGDTKLYLRTSEYETVDNDDSIGVNSQLYMTAERDGTWLVGASMLFAEESEEFSVSYVLYARDYSKAARVLSLDRPISGTLTKLAAMAPALAEEFIFTVPADGIYSFSLTGKADMKAHLKLIEVSVRAKTFIAQIDEDASSQEATIRYYLLKGRKYLIQAAGLADASAYSYTLLAKQEGKPLLLKAGQAISSTLTNAQSNFYIYTGKVGEIVEFVMTSDDFDTYLLIEDEQGQELRYDDDFNQQTEYASVGNYFFEKASSIVISASALGSSESGSFNMIVKSSLNDKTLMPPKDYAQGFKLVSGQELVTRLSEKSTTHYSYWANEYSIQAKVNEIVQVKLESRDFDGRLVIISPDGEATWENDDMNGLNPMVEFIAPVVGQYKVIAFSYVSSKEAVNRLYKLAYSNLGTAKLISAFVEDEIQENAELDDEGLAYKEYSYNFKAGQSYYILVYSDEFAVKLDFLAANGELQDSNRAFGDASNARLLIKVDTTGSYKIRVVNDSTEEGVLGGNFLYSIYEVR